MDKVIRKKASKYRITGYGIAFFLVNLSAMLFVLPTAVTFISID